MLKTNHACSKNEQSEGLDSFSLFLLLNKYAAKQESEIAMVMRVLKLPESQQREALNFIAIYSEELFKGVSTSTLKDYIDEYLSLSEAERWYRAHPLHPTMKKESMNELGNLILEQAAHTLD